MTTLALHCGALAATLAFNSTLTAAPSLEKESYAEDFSEVPGVGFMLNIEFPRFDEQGGNRRLERVDLTFKASGQIEISVENLSSVIAPDVNGVIELEAALQFPAPTDPPQAILPIVVSDQWATSEPLEITDGLNFSGPDFSEIFVTVCGTATPVNLSRGFDDLSIFTVDDDASMIAGQITASITSSVGGFPGAYFTGNQNPLVLGTVTVEYFYSTPGALCCGDCAPFNEDGTCGNGIINVDDLVAAVVAFGMDDGPCDAAPVTDRTCGNGVINIDDVIAIINDFGACP
ncbi:MAG: choice-of-anchor E domain-containing protein [Planctomycetota bacterium]